MLGKVAVRSGSFRVVFRFVHNPGYYVIAPPRIIISEEGMIPGRLQNCLDQEFQSTTLSYWFSLVAP